MRRCVEQTAWIMVPLMVALSTGCAVCNSSDITVEGTLKETEMPVAVLEVTPPPATASKTGLYMWGIISVQEASERFAEFAAHAAAEHGKLQVIHPFDVKSRLLQANVLSNLQPTPPELRRYINVLGCKSYLTARILRWRHSYIFVLPAAEIEYEMACRRAIDDKPIWTAKVKKRARGMSSREIALLSLQEMFAKLRG